MTGGWIVVYSVGALVCGLLIAAAILLAPRRLNERPGYLPPYRDALRKERT